MTEREAITELKRKAYRTTCYGNKVLEHEENLVAIEALEKQIPKKPIKSENQVVRYVNTYYCPICELGITGTNIAKWCYHCGQKLDWEGAERGEENE